MPTTKKTVVGGSVAEDEDYSSSSSSYHSSKKSGMTSSAMKTPPMDIPNPVMKLYSVTYERKNKIIRVVPPTIARAKSPSRMNPTILFIGHPPKHVITLIIPL